MRFRKTTVVVSAGVVLGLLVALWPRAAPRLPQVNLLRLSRTEQKALSLPAEPFDWSAGNLFADPQEGLSAEFEICNPKGTGVVLSREKVEAEYLGLQGGWTPAAAKDTTIKLKDPFANPPATLQIGMNRVQVFIPRDTERCRLVIRLRFLTAHERCREWLARLGVWRRFPKASVWFSDRLANTKHWREWRPEIELPRPIIEEGAHNERPGAGAGWRVPFAFQPPWPRAAQAGG